MFRMLMTFFLLCVVIVAGTPPAQAYLVTEDSTDQNCVPARSESSYAQTYPGQSLEMQAADFLALADGQYLYPKGTVPTGVSGFTSQFQLRCDNLGKQQSSVVYKSEIEESASVITIDESSIINLISPSKNDETNKATLVKTGVQGLYLLIRLDLGGAFDYPPSRFAYTATSLDGLTGISKYIVDNTFRGMPEGTTTTPAVASVRVLITDDNEKSQSGAAKGVSTYDIKFPIDTTPVVKITSTCQYTLSDGGTVDFGDQRVSQVTDDRNTTVRRTMTLNMDNCFGVNKVKTYLSTTATTTDSGRLLNNTVTDGAKNVAVALRVNASYTESGTAGDNAGKDMYFDGSNALEWNFGNTWEMTPLSKHIPLDVYLLRTGGEPTPGDYHATATIMMDFI